MKVGDWVVCTQTPFGKFKIFYPIEGNIYRISNIDSEGRWISVNGEIDDDPGWRASRFRAATEEEIKWLKHPEEFKKTLEEIINE